MSHFNIGSNPVFIPFSIAKDLRISHLKLASEAGDMEKILVAGTAVRAEGEAGWKEVEDKEKKEKTHFEPRLVRKGIQQKLSHFHNRELLMAIMSLVRHRATAKLQIHSLTSSFNQDGLLQ